MTEDSDDVGNGDPDSGAVEGHGADRAATPDEEAAADTRYEQDTDAHRADVASHEKHMMEIGADVKGEGQID